MADEEGPERGEINGGPASMDSIESRWVFQDEDDSDLDDDDAEAHAMDRTVVDSEDDEEEDDNADQRLIRTGPRVDSFDVEALEVPGALRNEYEDFSLGRKIIIAFQTLGVVFGDVGTSPLYTFSVMFKKAPINGNEDVIGAMSLVLYTLILIPLLKYVLVVLWANDDGEGGTFALYSLICRHAKVSLLPNQLPSDARISSFRLKVPSPELERSLKIKERLEASLTLKKLLLTLVLAGTAMVIADGVVTPAMSVVSAVGGLTVGVEAIKQDQVVMISVAFLVILFSVQKFGTSKVGLAVGPALFIWFCSLGGIGIYNLVKYDSSVFKAFNPIHIYYFFKRNSTKAWYSLGGCILCATGSEAMFADLCYFSVRSVQLTFVFLVLPCLMLGYLGQAAYLMENPDEAELAFFSSIPSGFFWPMLLVANIAALIASRAMTTATFSCIKQSMALGCFPRLKIIHTSRKFMGQIYIPVVNWFLLVVCLVSICTISNVDEIGNAYGIAELGVMMMTTILVTIVMLLIWQINIIIVLSFLIIFLGLELTFFSSVLWSVGDGSWIILVFAIIMFFIMSIWNYGSKLKYETEVKQKLSMDLMRQLGPNLGTIRAPGIGLLYNELVKGIPAILGHFLTTLPAIHSMIIFVCIKYVPVPVVPQSERFLFRRKSDKTPNKQTSHKFQLTKISIKSLKTSISLESAWIQSAMEQEDKQPLKEDKVPPQEEGEVTVAQASPAKSGGGWGGWGFSSVFSDLQKAAEEISRNAAVVAQTAAKSLADMQAAEDAEESSKDKERDSEKESQDGTESRDKHEKQRKAALDKLEKASQDSLFGQGLKVLDSSVENFATGAWQALGNALKGGTDLVHKIENSAVNLGGSVQQGGADGSTAPSLLETGKAFTSKGMQVLELVGKETLDLLITETGIEVNKNSTLSEKETREDQLYEEVGFDRCFYIYGGPEQLEELEGLSSHYALLFSRRKGKLSSEQKSVYDGKLKEVQQIFSLDIKLDGSGAESDKGKKKETRDDGNTDEMKTLHDSSVSKAADMAAGFTSALAGQAVNDIIQRTTGRLESLHSEGVHRLSELCCSAVSQLLILGKSIISSANKTQVEDVDADLENIDWPEDSVEKAKIIRSKAQAMAGYVEAVSSSFVTGMSDVAEAYLAAIKGASEESHEEFSQTSIQEKASTFSKHLHDDQTTALSKIQDGLLYLSYVVISTSMPAA